jgi:hypothetical protein
MPDALSIELPTIADVPRNDATAAPSGRTPSPSAMRTRLLMVLMGYIPFLHLATVITLLISGSCGYVKLGWLWSLGAL